MLTCLVTKLFEPIVTELFIGSGKINISVFYVTKPSFEVLRNNALNHTHCFIMKILNKQELQQLTINDPSGTVFKDFINLEKKCTGKLGN